MKSPDASMLADASAEIQMLRSERSKLRLRVQTLQETVDCVSARNAQLLANLQASNIVDTAEGLLNVGLLSVCHDEAVWMLRVFIVRNCVVKPAYSLSGVL